MIATMLSSTREAMAFGLGADAATHRAMLAERAALIAECQALNAAAGDNV